ncbi:MAG: NYN domain-containing protein [Promethearchaeota archaeon]|jgi:hypothetical protein
MFLILIFEPKQSYDDNFTINSAKEFNAYVVSNDSFSDFLKRIKNSSRID